MAALARRWIDVEPQPQRGAVRRGRRLDPGFRLRLARGPPPLRSRLRAARSRRAGLELYVYSAVWLLFGVALLALGFLRNAAALRHAGMALVCVVVAKVFLIDMAGPAGPAARLFVPRPGRGAGRAGLRLSPIWIRRRRARSRRMIPGNRRLSLDALRALQLERLQAARCAMPMTIRRRIAPSARRRASIPTICASLDDLRRFPFTAKADLRDAYPYGMLAIPREKCVRIHASSGTTGRPTVVGYSARDIDSVGRPDGALALRRRARGRATSSTTPTATACSPAASARTTAPSGWAARWCRCRAASASARSSSSASSARASC